MQHNILISKLSKLGIKGSALDWFSSYLSNRKQTVDINGSYSTEKNINCSVLQGSILGPLLFLCFINDFPNSTLLKIYMFADNTTCLMSGSNLNDLISLVNTEIQKMAIWYRSNKMVVNVKKTKYIIFHAKGKKVDNHPKIVYNCNENTLINDPYLIYEIDRITNTCDNFEMRSYKLLGVYFDEHLTFNRHAGNICAKLNKAVYFLNRAKNLLSQSALKSLYYALFHSHLLYCINITSCVSQTNIKKISILQKKAIRIISNAGYRDHTESLFLNLNILPFEKLMIQSKLIFMHQIAYNYCHISFENIWPKNSDRNIPTSLQNNDDFQLPFVRLESFKKIPLYSFAKTWNDIGDSRFQKNAFTFAQEIKLRLRENTLSILSEI